MMAEGVGFEPTDELPHLLISSQVPLTTQPPFQPFIIRHLGLICLLQFDFPILQSDTVCVKAQNQTKPDSIWQKTPYANLLRYNPSGKYFARIRVQGKLIRRSLKTSSLSVAKLRLSDLEKSERQKNEHQKAVNDGKMSFGNALEIYKARLNGNAALKPRSKVYREERIAALIKSWPGLENLDVRKITKHECLNWATIFAKKAAPSNYNNTIGTLRLILDMAVEAGGIYDNPARFIKRLRVLPKKLHLLNQSQFTSLVDAINKSDGGWNHRCAALVQFLAFGGFRKSEAANITWADCDFEKKEIVVRGDPETGTKNWSVRRVPMIPDMIKLLQDLREQRSGEEPGKPVMQVRECQQAINSACKKLSITRFTHHDLRHLFATRCIESGVDVPTVSRWLGHKDGGALAMKVYGHLRDQHSVAMAQKVSFSQSALQPQP
jgi:integrase